MSLLKIETKGENDAAEWMTEHLKFLRERSIPDLVEIEPGCEMMGFADGLISPGESCICLAQPQVAFRPHRLLIVVRPLRIIDPRTLTWAPGVELMDWKIGKDSMFKNERTIDTSVFAPTSKTAKDAVLYDQKIQSNMISSLFFRSDAGRHTLVSAALIGKRYNSPIGKDRVPLQLVSQTSIASIPAGYDPPD